MQNTPIQFSHPLARLLRFGAAILLFFGSMLLWHCAPTVEEDPGQGDGVDVTSTCTTPPSISDDWGANVNPNCFTNLQRLRCWTKDTLTVHASGTMDNYFAPLEEGSIKTASAPIHLYVVIHGWAPGLEGIVNNAKHNIQWWDNNAKYPDGGTWESSWFWTPTISTDPAITVSATGMVQQITAYEKAKGDSVMVLAYSWIDDSATQDDDVQFSEAYTNINGLRLAAAIQEAVDPGFLAPSSTNTLHIIGHSHGSKVATVAALELQQVGLKVDQLTILDTPEEKISKDGNGANLLGYYLNYMNLWRSVAPAVGTSPAPIFVTNIASYFGVGFTGSNLDSIVNIGLDPEVIYGQAGEGPISDDHAYSGTWYSGAAVGAQALSLPSIGLAWPPTTDPSEASWVQLWDDKHTTDTAQWTLTAGSLSRNNFDVKSYYAEPTSIEDYEPSNSTTISGTPSDTIVISGAGHFYGKAVLGIDTDNYGLAYRLNWEQPKSGDYLVVTVYDDSYTEYVIQVFDGKSISEGWHYVSFNADYDDVEFNVYYLPAEEGTTANISFTDWRHIKITKGN